MSEQHIETPQSLLRTPGAMLQLMDSAERARKVSNGLTATLARAFGDALSLLTPVGEVIVLRPGKGLPVHLRTTHVTLGRDHGTKTFRIEEPFHVEVDPTQPILATWTTYATPISERTGNDMDGSPTRGVSQHKLVRLSGGIFPHGTDLVGDEYKAFCDKMITDFLNRAAERATAQD